MARPLDGIRVLEWTMFQQGPVAGMMLADMGADVIKIEDRVTGDPARGMMKLMGASANVAGRNAYFEFNNRGKRSLTLDLRKPRAREILGRLVERSDVFLHNHRRDFAQKLELDYQHLAAINPKIIYATASGWGPKGPEASEGSFDYTGQARAGFMTATEEGMPPSYSYSGGPGDQMGAVITAYGILGALLARERLGVSQELDGSLLGGLMWLQGLNIAFFLLTGKAPRHTPRAEAGNPLWNHYKCKDELWMALAHLQPDKFWPNVCKALGIEHLQTDPRFAAMEHRAKNCKELIAILDQVFVSRTQQEWIRICQQNGVIAAPVNNISDLVNDQQVLANEYITNFDHPVWGPIKLPANPVIYSKTPLAITREAPEFGQHSEEVLNQVLGMGWGEISKLRENEVI